MQKKNSTNDLNNMQRLKICLLHRLGRAADCAPTCKFQQKYRLILSPSHTGLTDVQQIKNPISYKRVRALRAIFAPL